MEQETDRKFLKKLRDYDAYKLGGFRALDTYTAERFLVNDINKQAFDAAKNFDPKTQNLFFWGPTGSGKSHLACIAARGIGNTLGVTTVKQYQIARRIRIADGAEAEEREIMALAGARILVIDDLGVGKDTEFSLALLYEILDWRYMNVRGGLIVTSNLTLDGIADKMGDDRITSRLAGMCKVFGLAGEKDGRLA